MQPSNLDDGEDDEHSAENQVAILTLPFSNIGQLKKGSINKVFNEAQFSETYIRVLETLKRRNPATSKPKEERAATLSELCKEIDFEPKGLDENVKEEIGNKINGLLIHRRKLKEKYQEEYRWRTEMAEQLVEETDRMIWGPTMLDYEYSEFFVTPPHYNHYATRTPHWADRVEVGVAIREKSREKVMAWLEENYD